VRPALASAARFAVDLGTGSAASDIRQVVLPRLLAGKAAAGTGAAGTGEPLLLRRTASADRQFHDWWATTLSGKATARTVTISLLGPDRGTPIVSWRFLNARPVALLYGALDATTDLPLDETLELAFDRVERA